MNTVIYDTHTDKCNHHNFLDTHVDFSMERSEPEGMIETTHVSMLVTLGLLYMEFADAIREGDEGCILCCWHYFLVVFKVAGRKNYSIEAFHLLSQHNFIFSDCMHMQLLWCVPAQRYLKALIWKQTLLSSLVIIL